VIWTGKVLHFSNSYSLEIRFSTKHIIALFEGTSIRTRTDEVDLEISFKMVDILRKPSQDSSHASLNTTASGRSSPRTSMPDLDVDPPLDIIKSQSKTLERPITPPLVRSSMFCALMSLLP
jgi:hypothetical protein